MKCQEINNLMDNRQPMTDRNRRIDSFLPAELLREMKRHQQGAERWLQAWQQLDDEMTAWATPTKYLDGELTLKVASPARASRIRLESGDLMQRLRSIDDFRDISRIIVKVRPESRAENDYSVREDSVKYQHKNERLSAQSAEVIREAAEATDDPDLKQALERLGKREP